MRYLLLFGLACVAVVGVYADKTTYSNGGMVATHLTQEEQRLIESFRADPTPYREILYSRPDPHRNRHAPTPPPPGQVLGPRDVIDVIVQEGALAFNGKRGAYDPFSFRIQRGETIEVVARRRGKGVETVITVSYRSDGLHFDVPERRGDLRSDERGFVVIHEDPRWTTGEFIRFDGTVNSSRSRSEAQGIGFNIRYVAVRGR